MPKLLWRNARVHKLAFMWLAILGIALIAIIEFTLHRVKQPHFDEKLVAAKLSQRAMEQIKSRAGECKISVDVLTDPNCTGLVGEQFSIITTDQGDVNSKLTMTDPNWAAVFVDLLRHAKVDSGDYVAIAQTGSMPGANISILAAIEAIGAKPVIITSIGASMWGANSADFTYLDMEKLLVDSGIFKTRSTAATIGGKGDIGANLSQAGRSACTLATTRCNVPLLHADMIADMITLRDSVYKSALPPETEYAAYVNIGGGIGSVGSAHTFRWRTSGLIREIPKLNYPIRGTMLLFGERNVPIIDIYAVKKLAQKYSMPIAPVPIPPVPSGETFYKNEYRVPIVAIFLAFYVILVFAIVRWDVKALLKGKPHS